MVFNRLELPPNALGSIDDGEEEEDGGEEKITIKKSKSTTVAKNKKTVVEKIEKEIKNDTKTISKKKGVNKDEGGPVVDEKKGRIVLSRSVKKLEKETVIKSDIDMTEIKKVKDKKASKNLGEGEEETKESEGIEVEAKREVEGEGKRGGKGKAKGKGNNNVNDISVVKGKGISRVKRSIAEASSSSSSTDDIEAFNDQDTEYSIPSAKRTRPSRTIQ